MINQQFTACIQTCVECAQACEHCADSCLSEEDLQTMAECVRHDRDFAEICWMATAYMSPGSLVDTVT